VRYVSTRGEAPELDFEDVLLTGLARDGGLYVPAEWPKFSTPELAALSGKPYADIALAVMAKFTGASKDQIEKATPYVDPQGRIDVPEIKSQIAWYTSQGLIKGKVDADELIDKRYAIPLPGKK